jgi:hypothetical protein
MIIAPIQSISDARVRYYRNPKSGTPFSDLLEQYTKKAYLLATK